MATTPSDSRHLGADPAGEFVAALVDEMAEAWARGERPRAEEYLARHPGLSDEDAIRLVYEEACLRQDDGEEGVSGEILRRFPLWGARLELLLDCNRLLRSAAGPVAFPEVGEDLGDFRLLAEIGRGSLGRTYLASQRSLAHRLMVLKLAPPGHEEHLSLARLQHMHIVPLYFEQEVPERGLRVLGMPYLGGASLARVLADLAAVPVAERTGAQVVETLDRAAVALPTEEAGRGPFRKYLTQATYEQALCWTGACLADALQYAHDRGLVHLDVKPSNVLIAGDGQPMLLDFHLAQGPVGPGLPVPDRLGGTPGHLSPEQERAMAALRQGKPIPVTVDGRSDVYSLGLLLYEALGGDPGTGASPTRKPLHRCNPRVSLGLSDVIARCLATHPAERYPDAASLALDLRRHLSDLPLRGVPNRSPTERWRKWLRRRRPLALARGVFRLAAAAAVVAAVYSVRRRAESVDAAVRESDGYVAARRFNDANEVLDRGFALAARFPADEPRKERLDAARRRLLEAEAADELHQVVNRIRFRFGISPPSPAETTGLLHRGREIWASRGLFAAVSGGAGAGTTGRVRADLIDLATIWAELRVRNAPTGASREALGDAVAMLLEAEQQFGPGPALSRDLRRYARELGRTDIPAVEVPAPKTASEHYDLGRSYLRSGEPERAEAEFRRAADAEPGALWPHFSLGVCAYRLGHHHDAVTALSVCVALAPGSPECYYNRALAYAALGQRDRATADDTRALALRPDFADAALNRGILALDAGRHADALADFDRARTSADNPRTLGLIEYNSALVHLALKDRATARTCLTRAVAHGDEAARRLAERLGPE